MHNAAFAERRMNALYLPFHVTDLADFVANITPLAISGFSVTIPHKQTILRYLDDCDLLAAEIGAVNTVVVRGKRLYGYNNDYIGVLRAIESHVPLRSSRVLLIGAGGVARAAAFALSRAEAAVFIYARRPAQARALARAADAQPLERPSLRREFFDAIVNCTPVGLHAGAGSPRTSGELNCSLVMDLIYRPRMTPLLRLAARRGLTIIPGVEMFLAQGIAQYEMWTGKPAPQAVMRKTVMDALQKDEQTENPGAKAPIRR
jgi:3-dehydroquinate dehydratase/shikimate dehydrogenase